jgi:Tol biopolymer transport system component
VHRDLKPANIKVRDDGAVKVLDFGLAKLVDPHGAGSPDLGALSTLTSPAMTAQGMILGTAAYMAPEQALGRAVDKRADIWSFGLVLYEMLAGERLFKGENITETLAAVVKDQPDLSKAPRQVQRLLRRCLEKDPKKRLRDLGDVWDLFDEDASGHAAGVTPAVMGGRSTVAWSVAGVLAAALGTVSFVALRPAPPAPKPIRRFAVPMPRDTRVFFAALSPDGRSVVLSHEGRLAIRSLETGELRMIAGSDEGRAPTWSPDSRSIAFIPFNERALKVVAASGGTPQVLCRDIEPANVMAWGRDGTILFNQRTTLMRVSAAGGACTDIANLPGISATAPSFLPDGDRYLYLRGGPQDADRGLFVASLTDPSVGKRLLADNSGGLFAPDAPGTARGRLLFVRNRTLMAQRFDSGSLELSGDPVAVAREAASPLNAALVAASVADDGTLMYMTSSIVNRQMVWFDRSGRELSQAAATGSAAAVLVLSPDGTRVVFTRRNQEGVFNRFVQDFARNREQQIPSSLGAAAWAPDGTRLAFTSIGGTGAGGGIQVVNVNGGSPQPLLPPTGRQLAVSDWSRDGKWLLYTEDDPETGADVWLLPLGGEKSGAPISLLQTPANESQAQLSPDGKWLAYTSTENGGVAQVFVRPFAGTSPLPETKWQVSQTTGSGREPRWRADSKELYYVESQSSDNLRRVMMAVPIGGAPNPVGSPTALFDFLSSYTILNANFFIHAPSPDGQRFLVEQFALPPQQTLEVILNWADSE